MSMNAHVAAAADHGEAAQPRDRRAPEVGGFEEAMHEIGLALPQQAGQAEAETGATGSIDAAQGEDLNRPCESAEERQGRIELVGDDRGLKPVPGQAREQAHEIGFRATLRDKLVDEVEDMQPAAHRGAPFREP